MKVVKLTNGRWAVRLNDDGSRSPSFATRGEAAAFMAKLSAGRK